MALYETTVGGVRVSPRRAGRDVRPGRVQRARAPVQAPAGPHPVWGDLSALPAPPDFSAHPDLVTLDIDLTARTVNTNGAPNIGVSGLTILDYGAAGGRAVTTWARQGGRPVVIRCTGRLEINGDADRLHLWGFSGVHLIGFDAVGGDAWSDLGGDYGVARLNFQNLGYFDPAHISDPDHPNHEMRPVYIEGAHIDLKYKSASDDLIRVTGATASLNIVNSRLVGCGSQNGDLNAPGGHPDVLHLQAGDTTRNLNGTKATNVHNCVTSSTYQLGIMRGEEIDCDFVFRRHTHYALDAPGLNAQRGWWMDYDQPSFARMRSARFDEVDLVHQAFGGGVAGDSICRHWVKPESAWINPNASPVDGQSMAGNIDDPRFTGAPVYRRTPPPVDFAPAPHVGRHYVSPFA